MKHRVHGNSTITVKVAQKMAYSTSVLSQ